VDQFGGDDLHDLLNALAIFDELPFADAERIGLWGRSRGGMMTYLALKHTDRIDAAIVAAGVTDLGRNTRARADMEQVCTQLIPNWTTDRAAAIEARSALRWADKLPANVPILIVHGTADWRVDPRDALDMAQKLQEHRKPYRLLMLEGTDHAQTEFKETYEAAVRDWLDRYVRDGAPLPNLTPHGS
jgi:dipeptidyl aminopeptidase/acylaminoacyl peptidase